MDVTMIRMVGVEFPIFELQPTRSQFEHFKFLNFEVPVIEELAKAKKNGRRLFTAKDMEEYHIVVEKFRNTPVKKEKKMEFKVPDILVKVGWTQAKNPDDQPMFEELASAIEREKTEELTRFRIKKEVYNKYPSTKEKKSPAFLMMGCIKNRMAKMGYKTKFSDDGWLLIYNKTKPVKK